MRSKRGDPGNCELARSDSLLLREGLHGLDEGKVVLEVFWLESREATTHVVRCIGKPVRSCQIRVSFAHVGVNLT